MIFVILLQYTLVVTQMRIILKQSVKICTFLTFFLGSTSTAPVVLNEVEEQSSSSSQGWIISLFYYTQFSIVGSFFIEIPLYYLHNIK